jgi:hypothetical protein
VKDPSKATVKNGLYVENLEGQSRDARVRHSK